MKFIVDAQLPKSLLAIESELSHADVVEMTRKSLVVLQWNGNR